MTRSCETAVLGAGPAGLTAGRLLVDCGQHPFILEADSQVGGLARTVVYKDYRFDIGGHRFFTKMRWAQEFWEDTLGDDFLEVPRLSRIYYDGRFFQYPLRPMNALRRLGTFPSIKMLLSYLLAKVRPIQDESCLENYVINRFGRELYRTFFKTYTEKVWGLPCTEIGSEWAAQRIKGLSLSAAVLDALGLRRRDVKSLIEKFYYPRLGPGMLWGKVANDIEKKGGKILLQTSVTKIRHDHSRVLAIETSTGLGDRFFEATNFISSIPLRSLIQMLEPQAPASVVRAADSLSYRDLITVNLIVQRKQLFPDNWIYVHSEHAKVARIQNFKNWSRDMVCDDSTTSLGLEYFCSIGDGIWSLSDTELIHTAIQDLEVIGLCASEDIQDGFVFREQKAYPIYSQNYREAVAMIRGYLSQFENLQLIGRNGLHKYNNQDHSMLCARYAVENLFGANHDIWEVNNDDLYQEEDRERIALSA